MAELKMQSYAYYVVVTLSKLWKTFQHVTGHIEEFGSLSHYLVQG